MIYLIAFVLICICCGIAELSSKQDEKEKSDSEEANRRAIAQQNHEAELLRIKDEQETLRQLELTNATRELEARIASKRPAAFTRLLAEEFPVYRDDITYAKSEEILSVYKGLLSTDLVVDTLEKYSGQEEMMATDTAIQSWLVSKIAPHVSAEFLAFAQANPAAVLAGLNRAVKSSATLAAQ